MEHPPGKRSLVDDPNFLASLSDLDRGLDSDEDEAPLGRRMRGAPAPTPDPPDDIPLDPPPPRAHTGRMVAEPDQPQPPVAPEGPPKLFASSLPPIVQPAGTRRPLLDLFPPVPLERPPAAIAGAGTAPGPRLPRSADKSRSALRTRSAEKPPSAETAAIPETARAVEPSRVEAPPALADPLTYETFYGLSEKPFSLSTDPKFLYHSASHDEVAQRLLTAIRRRDGLSLVTGPFGTGKTTLCRVVTEELDRRTLICVLLEPVTSVDDLLKTMLIDFGVISRDDFTRVPHVTTREGLTATLQSFLASLTSLQASAVLVIDEAQQLPIEVLEQLPTIAEAGEQSRTLQVILVGQPALSTILRQSELRLLNEEVAVRSHLKGLAPDEIAGYVMHRLGVAGNSSRVEFDDAALERLYQLSGGVPRVVNLLCDRAMTRGFEASASVIDVEHVDTAAEDLDLRPSAGETSGLARKALTAAALIALMLVGAAGALWVFRDAVTRTIVQWENVPLPPAGPLLRLPVPLAAIPPPADIPPTLPTKAK